MCMLPHNFNLTYQIFQSVAGFYGIHPWHWYFSQGFPAMLGSYVVLFVCTFLLLSVLPFRFLVYTEIGLTCGYP